MKTPPIYRFNSIPRSKSIVIRNLRLQKTDTELISLFTIE